jgi:hypothetical protein
VGRGGGLAKKIGETAYRAICPLKHLDFLFINIISGLSGQSFIGLHSRCISRFVSSGGESDNFLPARRPFPPGMVRKFLQNNHNFPRPNAELAQTVTDTICVNY